MAEHNLQASQHTNWLVQLFGVIACTMDLCFLTIHRAGHLTKDVQGSISSTIIFKLLAFKGPLK